MVIRQLCAFGMSAIDILRGKHIGMILNKFVNFIILVCGDAKLLFSREFVFCIRIYTLHAAIYNYRRMKLKTYEN